MPQAYAVHYEDLPLAVREALHLLRAEDGRLWMMLRPLCRALGASAERFIGQLRQSEPWALEFMPDPRRAVAFVRLDAAQRWLDRFKPPHRRRADIVRVLAALLRGIEASPDLPDGIFLWRGLDERFTLEQLRAVSEKARALGFDPLAEAHEDAAGALGAEACR